MHIFTHKTLNTLMSHIALPLFSVSLLLGSAAHALAKAPESTQSQLETAVNGTWRSEQNRARDQYRHPLQTLNFFAIKPNVTVIELMPSGGAWYGEILAPFLHDHGKYIVANKIDNKYDVGQKEKFAADSAHYGKIKVLEFNDKNPNFGAKNSADFFLTFREVHNFVSEGSHESLFKAIFSVLKPGGVLGVVDHRAAAGKTLNDVLNTGYLPEEFVIAEAEKAGFILDSSSSINNNPKDTKDYPHKVWSLPPTLAGMDNDRAKYIAIGESDRFTLRFIKPKQ